MRPTPAHRGSQARDGAADRAPPKVTGAAVTQHDRERMAAPRSETSLMRKTRPGVPPTPPPPPKTPPAHPPPQTRQRPAGRALRSPLWGRTGPAPAAAPAAPAAAPAQPPGAAPLVARSSVPLHDEHHTAVLVLADHGQPPLIERHAFGQRSQNRRAARRRCRGGPARRAGPRVGRGAFRVTARHWLHALNGTNPALSWAVGGRAC
jgi:hypothetical protein